MNVELIRATNDADLLVGEAAAMCTASEDPDASRRGAMAHGHMSITEHATFTFRVRGVSRVLLAQLTRHRLASFSVRSQRYCGVNNEYIMPDTCHGYTAQRYMAAMHDCYEVYRELIREGVPEEDARYIIPQGTTCDLIMTMNARELLHFFSMRCCNRAQWEIRELADEMLKLCREVAPEVFRKAGAACQRGRKCPEGSQRCGTPRGGQKV